VLGYFLIRHYASAIMLVDIIKHRIKQAMLQRNELERDFLRVALGELQTAESRGNELDDPAVEKILRKMVKSNTETLDVIRTNPAKAADVATLHQERAILDSLLPTSLSPEEIVAALAPVTDAIRGAAQDGPATGIAMRHLKESGAQVDGKDVAAAVKQLRADA
jgi:uncharacterized protein YqeY